MWDEEIKHEQRESMAEMEKSPICDETEKKPINISFSIWPPSRRTRDAVVHRLIETLSTPSILSNRYGTFPHDQASGTAKLIEEDAFAAAAAGSSASADDDGVEILHVYSNEISKRMLDVVKSRSESKSSASLQNESS